MFTSLQEKLFETERLEMVAQQIAGRGISDPAVLQAMKDVPRHRFVPDLLKTEAYTDRPLPIGYNQTISQPYIVAYMTEQLGLDKEDKVLEVGTGSGYQAAVLAEIAEQVITIEIVPPLANSAKELLLHLGYTNITVIEGDGYKGYAEEAPYDAIIATAAPDHVPQALIDQLKTGGRMIIPVGPAGATQYLKLITRENDAVIQKKLIPVRFVPFTGEAQE